MARLTPAVQQITRAGLNPTLTAVNVDGDTIDPGNVFLYVDNGGGAPINVTLQASIAVDGLDVPDQVTAVPAGAFRLIGPIPRGTFARPSGGADAGKVYVDYSATTSVTRALVSL